MHDEVYRGERIYYDESVDEWTWEDVHNPKLSKVKVAIDKAMKAEINGTKAWAQHWDDEFQTVIITSLDALGTHFRITYPNGRHEKIRCGEVWADTTKNAELINQIREANKQIAHLQKHKEGLIDKLEVVDLSKIERQEVNE